MNEHLGDMDVFLQTIHELEERIASLIHKSNLSDADKQFIFSHIIIVPGKNKE
ncbi:hypothetical protein ACFQZT_25975 [Paenibacillus sp. GCM10027628]|uniref:hypothetical protein n=1 Tax=Paenibacillus sp. GCM10027628 TaxID=3273413 RepID=UPI00363BB95B